MPRNEGILTLSKVEQMTNTLGIFSPVISYEVPRSESFMLPNGKEFPFYMFLPTRETFTHDGTGDDTFSATYGISDSGALNDGMTAQAYVKASGDPVSGGITSIDYTANEVVVDHDTGEDLYVYYLPDNGLVQIRVVSPRQGGALDKVIWDGSLDLVHVQNQYSSKSQLTLDQAFPVPETFLIKVFYKHDNIQIYWHPSNKIGQFELPFKTAPRSQFPRNFEQTVEARM